MVRVLSPVQSQGADGACSPALNFDDTRYFFFADPFIERVFAFATTLLPYFKDGCSLR
jgi:hypothetical protein